VKSGKVKADGSDPDEEIINPINLAEADIQNKTTTFLPAVLLYYIIILIYIICLLGGRYKYSYLTLNI